MTCSSCGATLAPGTRFCRACGTPAAVAAADAPASFENRCRACQHATDPKAKFCRRCGASAGGGVSPPASLLPPARSGRRHTPWVIAAGALAACVVVGVTSSLVVARRSVRQGPDADVVRTALTQQLPPFIRVESLSIDSVQRAGAGESTRFSVAFSAAAVLASAVYEESAVEGDVILLTERAAPGTPIPLAGRGEFLKEGEQWRYDVPVPAHPLLAARTREAFGSVTTVVLGSPEERAYREARARADAQAEAEAKEMQRRADAEAAEAERRRRTEQARQLAEQQAEAARVEAARMESTRIALERQAQALAAERARLDAERQAQAQRDDAERLRLQDQRGRPTVAGPDPMARAGGRIPSGTEVTVRLASAIRSDAVHVEDRFNATTADDIVIGGRIVVPAGATVAGIVAAVTPATRTRRRAQLDLRFETLTFASQSVPVRAHLTKVLNGPGLKGDAGKAAVGAAAGAIIGALLGGGKGAAIGAGVGSGGTLAATEGQEIDLPVGSVVRIVFDGPVDIP
ncbi:MAG: zinc ribbon domain-containing protein [Vicinamibacterales bacterium]